MASPRLKYVYVAGPISKGDTLLNIRDGINAGADLAKMGFVPFIPHLDYTAYMWRQDAFNYEDVLELDFEWIRKCDALLRLPGESAGAEREIEFCRSQGIPVFKSVEALCEAAGVDYERN